MSLVQLTNLSVESDEEQLYEPKEENPSHTVPVSGLMDTLASLETKIIHSTCSTNCTTQSVHRCTPQSSFTCRRPSSGPRRPPCRVTINETDTHCNPPSLSPASLPHYGIGGPRPSERLNRTREASRWFSMTQYRLV